MKKYIAVFILISLSISCKNENKNSTIPSTDSATTIIPVKELALDKIQIPISGVLSNAFEFKDSKGTYNVFVSHKIQQNSQNIEMEEIKSENVDNNEEKVESTTM